MLRSEYTLFALCSLLMNAAQSPIPLSFYTHTPSFVLHKYALCRYA
jgi:hypothetical protein